MAKHIIGRRHKVILSVLEKAVSETTANVYRGVKPLPGILVLFWALLCLFFLNRTESPLWATISGAAYYLSLEAVCIFLFEGISGYLAFPVENKKLPFFIGHKLDILLVYPIMLMAIIGVFGKLLAAVGIYPAAQPYMEDTGGIMGLLALRLALLPIAAFAEETVNLLLVSFLHGYIKLPAAPRLMVSMLASASIFGLLHYSAWGLNGAVYTGVSYLPAFFATLYTGNIWISFLAHLYSNFIAFAGAYCSGSQRLLLLSLTAVPALWAAYSLFRKR